MTKKEILKLKSITNFLYGYYLKDGTRISSLSSNDVLNIKKNGKGFIERYHNCPSSCKHLEKCNKNKIIDEKPYEIVDLKDVSNLEFLW